jgi:UDP-N-acetylglucosamine--N-acetylmuramyl-(pentapeptide) pyrophosphoryl-undecaprenol N-acetylglucosamine transferase
VARILYGVSPIGLGHASRAAAVAERLLAEGVEIKFVSGGPAVASLREYGFDVEDSVTGSMPEVRGGEMKNALAWYYGAWRGFKKNKVEVNGIVSAWKPDMVVSDEEYSSVSVANEEGIPHGFITDEIELGFAKTWLARVAESRVSDWYRSLLDRVSLLVIPDTGADVGNRHHVGPIVRRRTRTRDEVLEAYSLPRVGRLLLHAFSGSGIGDYILEKMMQARLVIPDSYLVVMGNRGRRVAGEGVFDLGVLRDGQDLVAAADVTISTAGKSTIDEAACFGTPIITIPIRNHSEQERNAAALGYFAADVERLPSLIASRIGRREPPRSFGGAEAASELILSSL